VEEPIGAREAASAQIVFMAVPLLAGNGVHTLGLWAAFFLPVVVLLALDLGVFLRSSREPTIRESLGWTAAWAGLAALFALAIARTLGAGEAVAFVTAYVVEQALSVDNLFVFLLVFGELAVPKQAQKRALAWGVLGALVLRVAMLAAGGAFLERFHALGWVLGALLVFMGLRAAHKLRKKAGEAADAPAGKAGVDAAVTDGPRVSLAARILGNWLPVHDRFDEDRFLTEVGGRSAATPLLVAVVTILFADVVFALDSIPAVLGVSTTPIVVVTSNVFAVLGLRSMFFLLQGLLSRLEYLPHGLAAVLVVVGGKMLLGTVVTIPTWLSLASVLAVLGVAILWSLRVSAANASAEPEEILSTITPTPRKDHHDDAE
jgi:tellurite resistance protein TerC